MMATSFPTKASNLKRRLTHLIGYTEGKLASDILKTTAKRIHSKRVASRPTCHRKLVTEGGRLQKASRDVESGQMKGARSGVIWHRTAQSRLRDRQAFRA